MQQKYILFAITWLLLISFVSSLAKEPNNMKKLRERYAKLRTELEDLPENHKFKPIVEPILITGYYGMHDGLLGFNTNKGSEIGLCVDGCTNEMMHVLLHELAHATVPEFSHSPQFWKNLEELKNFASNKGLYTHIKDPRDFCGAVVHD